MESTNGNNGYINQDDMEVDIEFDKTHEAEIWRIISQYLQEKGFDKAATILEQESGVYLEGAVIQKFRNLVLDGKYDEVVNIIYEIEYDAQSICKVKQAIYEQKFLELLEANDTANALSCLRNEVIASTKEYSDLCTGNNQTLNDAKSKIKVLSSLIMCKWLKDIQAVLPDWDGVKGISRKKLLEVLQSFISPQKMIESGRLESLLKQGLRYQISDCKYHDYDKSDYKFSLLEKHKWKKSPLPNKLLHTISNHCDEVWYVVVSPDGTKLASVGKDKVINIWELSYTQNSLEVTLVSWIKKSHANNTDDINSIMWNKSSDQILTCCDNTKIFNAMTGDWVKVLKGNSEKIASAVWVDGDNKIISAEVENCMKMWSKEGVLLHTWNTDRYVDLVCNRVDNNVAYYTGSIICILNTDTKAIIKTLDEQDKVRSITMSLDGKYLLANTTEKEENATAVIHLWNIETNMIVQQYSGHVHDKYVLKWAFGGKYENYVVWGSEDDNIYIWNRHSGDLLEKLKSHQDTVNNIAWSPLIPNFFFSCSDDQSIKIWGISVDHKVKVNIDNKFKIKDEEMSDNGMGNYSDDQQNGNDDSESIGDSSLSDGSIFSDEAIS
jgi:WD40 repeat protein